MENKQHEAKTASARLEEAFDNMKDEITNSPFGRAMKRVIYKILDGLNKLLEGRASK